MAGKKPQFLIFKEIGGRPDVRLFRNNCGTAIMPDGSYVKYGLCNPGGSDLIGWRSITITPDMVGRRVALFTAIEVKSGKGRPDKDQRNFIKQVKKAGGLAGVARSPASAEKIIDLPKDNI
ncbi:MAG: VRR-NUC domain-containing protein [Candidatus Aminicenantes bacterium]|nr:VRR-NUC domain-containing protein [Candidatus Aminicenantes bacterium]NIQ69357.1 VRR-NUC domain-containing protein [Candidatus Aminicenantes bacterium]NIT25358.1 VRR-NUC domain-containing protein [Candidatus Aminicenantes bacterium]